jgi:hypothetical protein
VLIEAGVGLMIQPAAGYARRIGRYPYWAVDWGMKPRHTIDDYLRWLEGLGYRDRCLFAVSPDAYPDAVESQRRGLEYAPLIRELDYPAAVVAQDGAELLQWPWDDFDVLFIGGRVETKWKTSPAAEQLVHRARNAGLWCHAGRVNSLKRLERCRSMGINSCDGTFVRFWRRKRKGNIDGRTGGEVARWILCLEAQRMLPQFSVFEMPRRPVHREAVMRYEL